MADDAVRAAASRRLADLRGNYTDFTITCHGATWQVHRIVLAQHSKVLATACDGVFKEAKEQLIDLCDHAVLEVDALVEYLYKFDYELAIGELSDAICTHIGMIVIGDKYDIDGLRALAFAKFKKALTSDAAHAFAICAASNAAYAAEAALMDVCSFLVDLVVGNKYLNKYDSDSELIEGAMLASPQFAVDVSKRLALALGSATKEKKPQQYRCGHCLEAVDFPEQTFQASTNYGGLRCPYCVGIYTKVQWQGWAI